MTVPVIAAIAGGMFGWMIIVCIIDFQISARYKINHVVIDSSKEEEDLSMWMIGQRDANVCQNSYNIP